MKHDKRRCPWVKLSSPLYVKYHDREWGTPVRRDNLHFEFLVLEGAQAGLSWETILKKRTAYRAAFRRFDPNQVAKMGKRDISKLLNNPGIVRNKLKVESAIDNAKAFLEVQKEFGSFNRYIWGFVDGKPIHNRYRKLSDYPPQTPLSKAISKDLKRRGFRFVGPTIIYAYLQAIGIVNDHTIDCYRHRAAKPAKRRSVK